jgi:2-polyprenyl-3-methyl-5-hydroxy-6-metoxy-1,4-benzoquinol methylase/GNAT superfamily N-acetyltransferase
MYEYHWLPGSLVQSELLRDFAQLYTDQYGIWGDLGPNPGGAVRLSPERLRHWLVPDSLVVWSTLLGNLVGYAIAVETELKDRGTVSWVTQLVVHEAHRQQDVGKTLLFTIWRFTDHFAWGLLTANPFAIRALEKATRRRCDPARITRDADFLKQLAPSVAAYITEQTEIIANASESRANTEFFLDHSQLPAMLSAATNAEKPWKLGPLPVGWEWFAFTFHDQDQISLSRKELEEMLIASDKLTRYAYSRMAINSGAQLWATHHRDEVDFIIKNCHLNEHSRVVDFGCGQGRHTIELATRGISATGIDYIPSFVHAAGERSAAVAAAGAHFREGDCRTIGLAQNFDLAFCLYDVIGSYADENDNLAILSNLVNHTKPGGYVLLSVMNMELTERLAKNWFSLTTEPDKLLTLRASTTMETTGNVFNPDFYLIDRDTKIVYRKEQFTKGLGLPEEILVRDRRYTEAQICDHCKAAGLELVWSRFVRSGKWDTALPHDSTKAKEILVLCRKPPGSSSQGELFSPNSLRSS